MRVSVQSVGSDFRCEGLVACTSAVLRVRAFSRSSKLKKESALFVEPVMFYLTRTTSQLYALGSSLF